jgi:hypothetical protein
VVGVVRVIPLDADALGTLFVSYLMGGLAAGWFMAVVKTVLSRAS